MDSAIFIIKPFEQKWILFIQGKKKKRRKTSTKALQNSHIRRYGMVAKNMEIFVGLLKLLIELNSNIQVQRALK